MKKEARSVLHIVPALFGTGGVIGGGERYALELARNMAEVIPTRLLTFGHERRTETLGKLFIEVSAPAWFVRAQRTNPVSAAIFRQVAKHDVVHCHQQHVLASTLAALTARSLGKRVFTTDLGGGGWDLSSYVTTDGLFHGHLHLSEYSRRVFGHANTKNARVIFGGVDATRFAPGENKSQKPLAPLFVGRLLPHKGVNYLIDALPSDLSLDVVGPVADPRFFERLKTLAHGKLVTFHHDVSEETLPTMYRRALCIVLPSVYNTVDGAVSKVPELLGQTLLEGMASGIPAICTNVASMPELVENGVTGFVVPPNDPNTLREKLLWLISHPDEARRMGQSARTRVLEQFTWKPVVEKCLKAYRELGA